jgi:hypothetical protein
VPSRTGRSVLVWFTQLPQTADGYQLKISEVRVA